MRISTAVKSFISLLILAILHRWLAAPYLRMALNATTEDLFHEAVVGVWSDFWISMLLSLPIVFLEFSSIKKTNLQRLGASWVFLWTVLTAAHQSYTEFFRQQIIPFHLTYMFDLSFIQANGKSFFDPKATAIFTSGLLLSYWTSRDHKATMPKQSLAIQWTSLIVICVLFHSANLRWRTQWYVPESLQSHFLERLVANLSSKQTPSLLTTVERNLLATTTHRPPETELRELLFPKSRTHSAALDAYQKAIQDLKEKNMSPLIILVAAESFRPADSGWTRENDDPVSITQNLDELIHKGVLFTNAYSTGPVTRGGQEAIWCGLPTGTNTSVMRSFPQFKVTCVSDLAAKNNDRSLWIHGGDARFDSQETFWKHHQVNRMLLKSDFSDKTPKTGWGISDVALMTKAAEFLKDESKTPNAQTIQSMILSVTNHIPWDLPADADPKIKELSAKHPQERTTAYFDDSLGKLIRELKSASLWDQTVLVVVSDHGNLEAPRNISFEAKSSLKYEKLSSHINLVLSGGITESLVSKKLIPRQVSIVTSQAQIAPFLAEASALKPYDTAPDFMDVPLFSTSPWPVAVDLNQYLFLPSALKKIPKESVIVGNFKNLDESEILAATRYRAFLHTLHDARP